ncbi:unnamed protein product, partial [Trichobilharzia regenti]
MGTGFESRWWEHNHSLGNAEDLRSLRFESRGRGRGQGRGTFGCGHGIPFNSNRDFEHQSGPDRQDPRQYGRRDGNWNPQDADAQAGPESEEQLDSAPAETEETMDGVVETPVEEEPKSYTLEEYKAMRQSAEPAVIINNKNLRKANDGKDVFANMVANRKVQEVHEDGD